MARQQFKKRDYPSYKSTYVGYGSGRPPLAELLKIHDQLTDDKTPAGKLLSSEVLIDLAIAEPRRSNQHLNLADAKLRDVLKVKQGKAPRSHDAVDACLKLSQLALWKYVANGTEPKSDYESLLLTAKNASGLAKDWNDKALLVEFIPVLLMARADHHGNGTGYVGRLALTREDCSPDVTYTANPNWDCGLSKSGDLVNPSAKLQVKRTKEGAYERFERAGIQLISATKYGFEEPANIIAACVAESVPPVTDFMITSDVLSKMTGQLLADIAAFKPQAV